MPSGRPTIWPGSPGGRRRALVLCGVLLLATLTPAAVAGQEEIRNVDVSVEGGSVLDGRDPVVYLWQSDPQTVAVSIETGSAGGQGHYEVCLTATSLENGSTRTLQCQEAVLSGNATERVTFGFDAWPDGLRGQQTLTASVYASTLSRDVVANESVGLAVLARTGDVDGDGLTNREEVAVGTAFDARNTDDDGLSDGLELRTYGTDPTVVDTDGDGLVDGAEVNEHGTDPTVPDTDDDGLNDSAEIRTYGTVPTRPDTDGDGLDDASEVTTYGSDPTRPDTDGDGLDDRAEVVIHETDPTVADTDDDGLDDALEVSTYETDPRNTDTDADGLTDGSEVYEMRTDPARADTDGDGLKDGPELTAHGTNPNRADTDGDGLDDGAELQRHDTDPLSADTDGDGVDDRAEVRPVTPLVPRWGWTVLVTFGAAITAGAVWVRRRGYPAVLQARGLGEAEEATGTAHATADAPSGDATARELPLPNRQRVLTVLEANDGRMQQSAIVDETDWSKAKVSRVLKRMAEDDQVTKISIGRENIVTLPGREPERSKRPFDDGVLEGITER